MTTPTARPTALPAGTRWLLALASALTAGLLLLPGRVAPAAGEPAHAPAVLSAPAPAAVSSTLGLTTAPRWLEPQPEPVAPSIP